MGVRLNKRKKKDGGYCYYIYITQNGNRIGRSAGTDRRLAMKQATEWRRKLALGLVEFNSKKSPKLDTFDKFCDKYLEAMETRLKHSSWTGYKNLIDKHLRPAWGKKPIDDITTQDIRDLLTARKNAERSANNLRVCVSSILQYGVETDVLKANAAHNLGRGFGLKNSSNGLTKKSAQFLTKDQVTVFLKTVQTDAPDWYDFVLALFRTGMRLGELVALAWEDVNFDTKQIKVCRNYTYGQWDTVKSGNDRYVDMSPVLQKTLAQRLKVNGRGVFCPSFERKTGQEIHLVFPNLAAAKKVHRKCDRKGEVINSNRFRLEVFKPALLEAGLPDIRIHDCRHTFASLLLLSGLPIHYVQQQLGHAQASTTMNIYGHIGDAYRGMTKCLD